MSDERKDDLKGEREEVAGRRGSGRERIQLERLSIDLFVPLASIRLVSLLLLPHLNISVERVCLSQRRQIRLNIVVI